METNESRGVSFDISAAEVDRAQDAHKGERRQGYLRSSRSAVTRAVSQKTESAEPGCEGESRKGGPSQQMRCETGFTSHVEN